MGEDWFTVYLIPETLRTTVLGGKREGSSVNIEIDAQTQVSDTSHHQCSAVIAVSAISTQQTL